MLSLAKNESKFRSAGIAPLVISFSDPSHVKDWIEETQCPFPVFGDIARKTYVSFGLPRAIKAVMGTEVMRYYGEKKAQNEPLPNMGLDEDTIQLGGDFTICTKSFQITFAYPSKTAKDRPSINAILTQ